MSRFMTIASTALLTLLSLLIVVGGAQADTAACAVPNGTALPDLVMDERALRGQVFVTEEKFQNSSCTVQEGFVSTPGPHTLLRFTTATPNIGQGALVIGDPNQCPGLFTFSACHGHLHFKEYTDYRLWTEAGYAMWVAGRDLTIPSNTGINAAILADAEKTRDLITGRKAGFCMIDSLQVDPSASSTPRFMSCSTNQGLSAGWEDRYDARLDGQYVEVDGLKEGIYVLENHVNAEHLLPETDYSNNSTAIRIHFIPRRGQTPPSVEVLLP
jgi:lysyl oxidase